MPYRLDHASARSTAIGFGELGPHMQPGSFPIDIAPTTSLKCSKEIVHSMNICFFDVNVE